MQKGNNKGTPYPTLDKLYFIHFPEEEVRSLAERTAPLLGSKFQPVSVQEGVGGTATPKKREEGEALEPPLCL
jgi:hypothetical protein